MKRRCIRVVVVDDSRLAQTLLGALLASDPDIEVVGTADNGVQAVAQVRALKPDLVLMDIEMPVMDGLEATSAIMAELPCPILLVTGAPSRLGAVRALDGLARGALDLLPKPALCEDGSYGVEGRELVRKVRALSTIRGLHHVPRQLSGILPTQNTRPISAPSLDATPTCVVGIVASTGGPTALSKVLSDLPTDLPAAVVVVQHMTVGFEVALLASLQKGCALPVRLALDGDSLRRGEVLLAPPDTHTLVVQGHRIALDDRPPVRHQRPAGTLLLESLADLCGPNAVGVVLTGMGEDGAPGVAAIRAGGGSNIAQDEASSVVFGMPRAAIATGCVDAVLPIERIAAEIVQAAGRIHRASRERRAT